jgi:hypothetical protein
MKLFITYILKSITLALIFVMERILTFLLNLHAQLEKWNQENR